MGVPHRAADTLVVGLGNPILTDDGVGVRVVRAVQARLGTCLGHSRPADSCSAGEADFAEASVGGLRLVEAMAGYRRVIVVDAIQTPGEAPGTIVRLSPRALRSSQHAGSTHDLSFAEALAWGREIGMPLPDDEQIIVVAIEAKDLLSFGEQCTPEVAAAIPRATELVMSLLQESCLG